MLGPLIVAGAFILIAFAFYLFFGEDDDDDDSY